VQVRSNLGFKTSFSKHFFRRFLVAVLAFNLLASIDANPVGNEVECRLQLLGEFVKNWETDNFDQVIGCIFDELSISEPHTRLSNPVNQSVTKLELSDANNVNYLPDNIAEVFPNVRRIKGYRTGLKTLTYSNLQNLSNVDEIWLRFGEMESIEENAFKDTPKVKEVLLSNNKLKALPENLFSNLEAVKDIRLNSNELTRIEPNSFSNNKQLITLWLSSNKLKNIEPGTFDNLHVLIDLKLDDNEISELQPIIFKDNKELTMLSLSGNKFASFDSNLFAGLTKVYYFSLSSNPLEVFDFAIFKENKAITKLHMDDCKINKILNIETVDVMEGLYDVKLTNNVCIDEHYDFSGLQFKLKRDVNKKCKN
jgi:Leucine-rich repeat (LRR) protein